MRIAVVGAGPGGLCAVRTMKNAVGDATVVGFEINEAVGGAWIFRDGTGTDEYGVPYTTSMYKSLRTNLPKQVMQFSDYPIPENYESFIRREDYLKYLKNYAEHFDIEKHYKFCHMVVLIKFVDDKWDVTFKNLKTQTETTERFDYVIISNGHGSHPSIPDYEGVQNFKGDKIHSHDYRTPDQYRDKRVLLVGNGPSGFDLSLELRSITKKLILSSRKQNPFNMPFTERFLKKPKLKEFTEDGVIFDDGTIETIDRVIFCTGYSYYCPFLDESCGLTVDKYSISPLYRHIVNVEHPSMMFMGVPKHTCVIPTLEIQARYVAAVIRGDFKLPSKDLMLEHIREDFESKDKSKSLIPKAITHVVDKTESLYYCELRKEAGVQMVPLIYPMVRKTTLMNACKSPTTFRNYVYNIKDDETMTISEIGTGNESEPIHADPDCVKMLRESKAF